MHYSLPILLPTVATLLALASVVYLVQRYYEQSFVKEMQDFIKGPKRAEKAANTEDEKELESKIEPKISNLIDFSDHHEIRNPSAPPYENEQLEDPSGKLLAQSNGSIDPILHGGISCV